jgi:hypothetical protein
MERDKPIPIWCRCISTKESVRIVYISFSWFSFTLHTYALVRLVEALRCKPEGRGFDSRWGRWDFSLTYSFQPHCGSGVDLACNINESQEYFLGGKGGRCVGPTTLHLHVPIVLKSGSINLPEPSWPLQAFNGIALPFRSL